MNNIKNSLFYVTIIGGFTALIYWVISKGSAIDVGRKIVKKQIESNHWNDFLDSMVHNLQHPLAILLAQIVTIIIVARIFGWFFRKIGQPSVIV